MTHPATLRAVRTSIVALGVGLDVGVVFPPKPSEERGYGIWQNRDLRLDEILSLIPRLAAQNVRGGNIFMRLGPEASKKHPGLVLLDDLSADSVRRLSSAGFEPCLVTETSPSNYQAWVRLIDDGVVHYDTMRLVARHLAAEFDGDPRAVSPRQPGRIPGFTNRKLKHRRPDGSFPYVRVVDAHPGCVASRGRELIARLTPDTAAGAAGAPPETLHKAATMVASVEDDVGAELNRIWFGEQARIGREIVGGRRPTSAGSASEVDFATAVTALRFGVEENRIAGWLQNRRHEKNGDYGFRTVRAAIEHIRKQSQHVDRGLPRHSM